VLKEGDEEGTVMPAKNIIEILSLRLANVLTFVNCNLQVQPRAKTCTIMSLYFN